MEDLSEIEIWGAQEKTEIGGFIMIGPVNRECNGCTAYVCNRFDAELIITAVNNYDDLSKFLKMVDHCLNDGIPIEKDDPIHNIAKKLLDSLK